MTAFYLCSAEVRLALYNLRQSSPGQSAGEGAQTYTCVSTVCPRAAGFIWSGAHSPVAALPVWSTPWIPPSGQESNRFLPHLLEDLFLVLFQPLPCEELLSQFLVPARVFPVLPHLTCPFQHSLRCSLSIRILSEFPCFPFIWAVSQNHSPAVQRGLLSDTAIYLRARNSGNPCV